MINFDEKKLLDSLPKDNDGNACLNGDHVSLSDGDTELSATIEFNEGEWGFRFQGDDKDEAVDLFDCGYDNFFPLKDLSEMYTEWEFVKDNASTTL